MTTWDVIVVGAGISGLCAARRLVEAGVKVLVLEADTRIGGRILTKTDNNNNYIDFGAAYIADGQRNITQLAEEFGVKKYKIHTDGDLIYYGNEGPKRVAPGTAMPFGGQMEYLDHNNFMRTIDELGAKVSVEEPWNSEGAEELDRKSFQQFINETCWSKNVKQFAQVWLNLGFLSEPWESSLLWVLWYVKASRGARRPFSSNKFIGGAHQICDKLVSEKIGQQNVLTGKPVSAIDYGSAEVTITTLDGTIYKAKYAIVAMPPTLQSKIHFTPPLPGLRNQLNQKLPMGAIMKCVVFYKTPFWRESRLSGMALVNDLKHSPISWIMDDTKPDGKHPAIVCFVAADSLKRFCRESKDNRKKKICTILSTILGSDVAMNPVNYEEFNWIEQQYSGGGWAAVWPPGLMTTHGHTLREAIGRVHFAGTETATYWTGYMEGAVMAGMRAAGEVLVNLGKADHADERYEVDPISKSIVPQGDHQKWMPSVQTIIAATKSGQHFA